MKQLLFLLVAFNFLTTANAQPNNVISKRTLKKVMEVKMPAGDGSNGGSVAYNPIAKRYYIPMVGNAIYPMAIFDEKGKELTNALAGNDIRGLWYNPTTKQLEGNCYDEAGWIKYTLDAKGNIAKDGDNFASDVLLSNSMYQPHDQAVGCFSSQEKSVYFLTKTGTVALYDMKGTEKKTFDLKKTKDGTAINFVKDSLSADEEDSPYNGSLIVTTTPKAEIGLLHVKNKKIELYNKTTGVLSAEWQLPKDAIVYNSFNFSYANNMVWLFDKENRKWVVYK
jgi:hypothetical protein